MKSLFASRKYDTLIKECEDGLRAGRGQLLRTRLASVNSSRIPRQYRKPIASLCRRAGLNQTGLRILSPIVHPLRKLATAPADSSELAEYAILLSRIGLVQEAFWTIDKVNPIEAPEADLFRSHFYFSRWDYSKALPHLKKYLSGDLAPYAKLVGNVNLSAALVQAGDKKEALEQIEQNIEHAKRDQHRRLWLNSLELKAELHIKNEAIGEAQLALKEAVDLIDENQVDVDSFYVSIWQAVLTGLQSGQLEPMLKVRGEAIQRGLWERVREIDLYLCKIEVRNNLPNVDRIEHLIFGTPYPAFREKVFKETGCWPQSNYYILGNRDAPCVDITAGNLVGLKPGKKVHQVLDIILRDFYRPASVGALFSELYPTERFNVRTSPSRVHQVLCRTRAWLKAQRIPVNLKSENHGVQLQLLPKKSSSALSSGQFSFCVPLDREALSPFRSHWARLQKTFTTEIEFLAIEARQALGMKPSTFKSMMQWALQNDLVVRNGLSVSTKYRLK